MQTRPQWFDEQLFPVESHWLDIDGHQVHYVDEGDGPILLMLHGNPTWSFLYRRLIAGLKHRFRCIAVDYPGFGLSTAVGDYGFTAAEQSVVIGKLVTALDLSDITLVVQDWGGPIGIGAALGDLDRYSSLVIGNTWGWPNDTKQAARFSDLLGRDKSGELLTKKLNLFVGQIIPRSMKRRKLTPAELAMYKGPFPTEESRVPVQVFPAEITGARPFLTEVESGLERLKDLPAMVLWANRDPAFGASEMKRWQRTLPKHHTYRLIGAGHYWQDDAGEEAALAIADWWDHHKD